ncbi:uncharacterized protein LOC136040751 [Artemia franciscana]|uniref:uncharacterized protein LOC136040751 n=1 Tax=Artemia franciscana TaxID=6661 RepID=UPI0032DAF259
MEEVLQVQWSKADGDPCSLIELHPCLERPSDIPLQRPNVSPHTMFLTPAAMFMYLIREPEGKKMPSFLKEGDQLLQIGSLSIGSFSFWTHLVKPGTDPHCNFLKNKIKEEMEKNNFVTLLIRRRPYEALDKYVPFLKYGNTKKNK